MMLTFVSNTIQFKQFQLLINNVAQEGLSWPIGAGRSYRNPLDLFSVVSMLLFESFFLARL